MYKEKEKISSCLGITKNLKFILQLQWLEGVDQSPG